MLIDSINLKRLLSRTALPQAPPAGSHAPACVFLLLFEKDGPHILAIQKTDTEGYPWRNQVALPGGHIDETDASPLDAALRELEEEVNIPSGQVEVLGSMGHFQTINDKDIQVFVGMWSGEGPVSFQTAEIARVLEVPLDALVLTHQDSGYHNRRPEVTDLTYPLEDAIIWGATARILHFFIEMVYPLVIKNDGGYGVRVDPDLLKGG